MGFKNKDKDFKLRNWLKIGKEHKQDGKRCKNIKWMQQNKEVLSNKITQKSNLVFYLSLFFKQNTPFLMEGQFNKLPKWIKTPPDLKLDLPFLKGKPIRPVDNNKILYEIQTGSSRTQVAISLTDSFQVSTENKLFEDMCHMTVLNEPEVLNNLIERYKKDLIFTYIGPTLIVLNPYKYLPQLFDNDVMLKIRQRILESSLDVDEPHAYMIAGKAYLHMKTSEAKQAIVISGQSGAGKTQTTKYCMKILTSLSHPGSFSAKQEHHSVEEKILSCNPLLEAFGNSKTIRNDNSSRFGKYVQMYFGEDNTIKGANVQSYLLQKSRVVSITAGERTYHAFYALIASKKYNTKPAKEYKFLSKSNCFVAAGVDDAQNFNDINDAMESIEFEKSEQDKIWLLLKAILEMGNIEFNNQTNKQNHEKPCTIVKKDELKSIAEILEMKEENLEKVLLFDKKVMMGEVMYKAYTKEGCQGHRNTFCKAIYNSIFEFILQKIQVKLRPSNINGLKSINILDIFGFQNFDDNSLEQLCINFTNQKLLRLYNEYIFKRQMELLMEDGLSEDIKSIKPPTNDAIIVMMNGNGVSIFSIINDNTQHQQYTDQNIKTGIQDRFLPTNQITVNPKKQLFFTIKHSQCNVEYNVEGFKMKNLDKVNDDVVEIINKIKMLKCDKDSAQKTGRTLLKKFGLEIEELIKELSSSNVHFIRCIKPNEIKKAKSPVDSYILSQVRYLGVFETIQIRKKTFPVRKEYTEFVKEYKMMFPGLGSKETNMRKITEGILKEIKSQSNEFMLGNKRVYINERIENLLNKMTYDYYKKRNEQIKKLQLVCKRFIFRSKTSRKVKTVCGCNKIFQKLLIVVASKKKFLLKEGVSQLLKNLTKARQQENKRKQMELKAKQMEEMRKKAQQDKQKMMMKKPPNQIKIQTATTTPIVPEPNPKTTITKTQSKIAQKTSQKPAISKQRQKQLQQINQKFFKYTKVIVKASNKMSTAVYFEQMKKVTVLHTKRSTESSDKKSTAVNETLFVQPPEKNSNPSIFKLKNSIPKPEIEKSNSEENKFSQSFYNEESIYISQGADVIFTGNLKIQMFENSLENQKRLNILKSILGEKYKSAANQSQVCSPHSEDSTFKLEATPPQIMNKIVNFPIDDFFQKTLRKRTGVFGMKKDYSEILVFKPRPLTKTLTQLTPEEESQAIKVFKLLLKIGEQTILDNVFKLVDNVMRYCQQTSSQFKNEIFLQLIKQSNNDSEVPAIRIYQTLSVYLHIYTPDEQFMYAALHLFFMKISQKKFHEKEEEFLRYLYKKIIRKIQKPHGVGYMPIKYQIMALMSKRQISIPIYLPIGSNILVKAESYETFSDIKKKVLEELGINTSRIPHEFFAFFEVVNYENTELEESPVNQNSVIWDVMTYWELAKQKYQESGVPPPYFSIMVKIKFPFECTYDDEQTIEIYFAQCYFDYSMGRIRLELRQMSMMAACIKKIKLPNQPNQEIEGCFPLWMSKLYDEETFKKYILDNLAWLDENNLDILALKYKFLQICAQSPLSLTFAIPTEHSLKLFLKPKRIYLVEKGSVVAEYSIREIAKWSNNHESFIFEIKKRDGSVENKTHMIMTEYSHLCTDYLNKVSEYLLKYGGRNKKESNMILQGI